MPGVAARAVVVAALAASALGACEDLYPEVIVVNRIDEWILVRNASFSGCVWPAVLAHGEATAPGRCLPGADRVHFQKLDLEAYPEEEDPDAGAGSGLVTDDVNWFNYQTISLHRVEYGDLAVIELTRGDLEQDFSVPGPYGH